MSYFGGSNHQDNFQMNITHNDKENSFNDYHGMNTSFSNLKEMDRSLNDFGAHNNNEGDIHNIGGYGENGGDTGEGNPGLIEKKELKELEIYDPLKRTNIDFIPAVIKVPVAVDDPSIQEKKKLISEKEKWLGIGQIPFILVILVLTLLILIGLGGLVTSAVLLITAANVDYLWKIFGICSCSLCIIICIVVLVFFLIYAHKRSKKYKDALKEELRNTDENGNPIKETEISKIYKHTKKTFGPKPKPVTNKIPFFKSSPPVPVIPKPTMQMVPVSRPTMSLRTVFQKIMPRRVVNNSANSSQFLIAPNPTPIASPNIVQIAPQPQQVIVQRTPSIKPPSSQLVMVHQPRQPVLMQHQPTQQVQQVLMQVPQSTQYVNQQAPIMVGSSHLKQHTPSLNYVQMQNPNPVSHSGRSVILQANNINPMPFQTVTVPVSYQQH